MGGCQTHSTEVEGYTDSDSNYAGNTNNRKSTSGYVFTYGGGAISWRSKLQECTTLSTTEAECIATSDAAKEVVWLHRLSANFATKRLLNRQALTIHCDSLSAIHLIQNQVYHAKKKNIELQFHHIRELVAEEKLEVQKIDSEVNIVDCLMKPLQDQRFRALRTKMGLRQVTEQDIAKHRTKKGKARIESGNQRIHGLTPILPSACLT